MAIAHWRPNLPRVEADERRAELGEERTTFEGREGAAS
jgi:hypothetical protein